MALSDGIDIAYEFTPEMNNEYKLEDFSGLKLVSESICPHYTNFKSKFSNFDLRLEKYLENGKGLVKIDDGEAVVYANERVYTLITNS